MPQDAGRSLRPVFAPPPLQLYLALPLGELRPAAASSSSVSRLRFPASRESSMRNKERTPTSWVPSRDDAPPLPSENASLVFGWSPASCNFRSRAMIARGDILTRGDPPRRGGREYYVCAREAVGAYSSLAGRMLPFSRRNPAKRIRREKDEQRSAKGFPRKRESVPRSLRGRRRPGNGKCGKAARRVPSAARRRGLPLLYAAICRVHNHLSSRA